MLAQKELYGNTGCWIFRRMIIKTYHTNLEMKLIFFLPYCPLDVFNLTEEVHWVKVNANMTGYYIVHYADDDWEALIKQLKANPYVLSDKDRANLINNIFELAG